MSRIDRYAALVGAKVPAGLNHVKGTRDNTRIIEYFLKQRNDLCSLDNLTEIIQWLSLSETISGEDLVYLNSVLSTRSFVAGNKLSLADVAIFDAVTNNAAVHTIALSNQNIARWLDHVSFHFSTTRIVASKAPTLFPFISALHFETASAAPSTPSAAGATAGADATKPEGKGAATSSKKAEKKEGKEKVKKENEAKPAAEAAPAAPVDDADPSKLDIRVGLVLKCWNHPDSEKLLCEEIDVGEEAPRRIGSGIRAFYSAEQLVGRKVFVLANLKERSLAGFPSQGMVLCAANADHSAVALLEPPASSKPGDRVTFAGYAGEPAPAAQVAKKKILEKVAPDLKTNEAGVPTWRNILWSVGADSPSCPMPNSQIS